MKRMTFEEIELKLNEIERLEHLVSVYNSKLVDCVLTYDEPGNKKIAENYFESMIDIVLAKIKRLKGELTR